MGMCWDWGACNHVEQAVRHNVRGTELQLTWTSFCLSTTWLGSAREKFVEINALWHHSTNTDC